MKLKSMTSQKPPSPVNRQKRFLLIVPLLVFPFLTGAFWALGGGSGGSTGGPSAGVFKGLDMSLPAPHFDKKDLALDKLGFYQKAAKDSARLAEKEKDDPYWRSKSLPGLSNNAPGLTLSTPTGRQSAFHSPYAVAGPTDPNEEKVTRKLDELKKIINQPQPVMDGLPVSAGPPAPLRSSTTPPPSSPDMERLEKILQAARQADDSTGQDPQLDRIDHMLDKVLKIQHPEIAAPQGNQVPLSPAPRIAVAKVASPENDTVRSLDGSTKVIADTGRPAELDDDDGFFSFDDDTNAPAVVENTIHAVVAEDQTLVSGATIRLRLTEDVRVNGVVLPRDNFVYGAATLNDERLLVSVKSVLVDNTIYPVNWQVYDLDGMAGIFIPGSVSRDVSKESAAEGVNSMGLTTLDASLGAQAATAGIQAARNLVSKKVRLVRVSIKAGHEVLLMDSKTPS